MEVQKMIEKLKLVDARFGEAGWLQSYEHRQTLAEVITGLEHLLQQHNVIGCKELLLQMKNKEMSLVQDKSLEMSERKGHAKNKFALDYVMKMLDELPAL